METIERDAVELETCNSASVFIIMAAYGDRGGAPVKKTLRSKLPKSPYRSSQPNSADNPVTIDVEPENPKRKCSEESDIIVIDAEDGVLPGEVPGTPAVVDITRELRGFTSQEGNISIDIEESESEEGRGSLKGVVDRRIAGVNESFSRQAAKYGAKQKNSSISRGNSTNYRTREMEVHTEGPLMRHILTSDPIVIDLDEEPVSSLQVQENISENKSRGGIKSGIKEAIKPNEENKILRTEAAVSGNTPVHTPLNTVAHKDTLNENSGRIGISQLLEPHISIKSTGNCIENPGKRLAEDSTAASEGKEKKKRRKRSGITKITQITQILDSNSSQISSSVVSNSSNERNSTNPVPGIQNLAQENPSAATIDSQEQLGPVDSQISRKIDDNLHSQGAVLQPINCEQKRIGKNTSVVEVSKGSQDSPETPRNTEIIQPKVPGLPELLKPTDNSNSADQLRTADIKGTSPPTSVLNNPPKTPDRPTAGRSKYDSEPRNSGASGRKRGRKPKSERFTSPRKKYSTRSTAVTDPSFSEFDQKSLPKSLRIDLIPFGNGEVAPSSVVKSEEVKNNPSTVKTPIKDSANESPVGISPKSPKVARNLLPSDIQILTRNDLPAALVPPEAPLGSDQLQAKLANENKSSNVLSLEKEEYGVALARNVNRVRYGDYEFDTWYGSPAYFYPGTRILGINLKLDGDTRRIFHESTPTEEVLDKLYVCQSCFKYTDEEEKLKQHRSCCRYAAKHPGRCTYDSEKVEIRMVSGIKHRLYCQNLCLFGKLFLDNKSTFFKTESFDFFVAYSKEERIPMGFFSKEHVSWDNNSLAVITVFPPFQGRHVGKLLIDLSYYLCRQTETYGSPEKPLSAFGLASYLKYWKCAIARYLLHGDVKIGYRVCLEGIALKTGIHPDDILLTLVDMRALARRSQSSDDTQRKRMARNRVKRVADECEYLILRHNVERWVKQNNVDLRTELDEKRVIS